MSKLSIEKVTSKEDRSLPIFDEFEEIADRIRARAFKLFASRGRGTGQDIDDWLAAESEICWPAAELVEEKDAFLLKVALPGFDPEDIEITATPHEIILKAKHETRHEERGDDDSVVRWSQLRADDVYRRVQFDGDVDVDRISAKFRRGVLTLKAPKASEGQRHVREIKVSPAA